MLDFQLIVIIVIQLLPNMFFTNNHWFIMGEPDRYVENERAFVYNDKVMRSDFFSEKSQIIIRNLLIFCTIPKSVQLPKSLRIYRIKPGHAVTNDLDQ